MRAKRTAIVQFARHDVVGRERHLGRKRTHLHDAPATPGRLQTRAQCRGTAGALQTYVGQIGKLGGCGLIAPNGAVGADRLGHRKRSIVDVAHDHVRGACQPRCQHAHAADGAPAGDEHGFAQHRAGAVNRMQADRQRLGAGDLAERDLLLGDRCELRLPHHEAFAEHALRVGKDTGRSEKEHVPAQIAAAGATVVAAPARMRWIDRDLLSGRDTRYLCADGIDHAGGLMARDQRFAHDERADPAVLEIVQVRSADAACAQAQQHVARPQLTGGARGLVLQAQIARAVDDASQRNGVSSFGFRRALAQRQRGV